MKVFVAGATGAIGARLVPQLVARGHEVFATTRAEEKVERLRATGAHALVVDGLDRAAVTEAVMSTRPDTLVHEMTALSGTADLKHFDRWFAATNELRTRGTDNLLAAARDAGVPRIVAQSYTGWNNKRTGDKVTVESDGFDTRPAEAQRRSMAAIRYLERTMLAADGVILRYGSLYGPGASDDMADLARTRKLPVVGSGAGVWSWIHVDDAAAATVAAIERAEPGVYNIVDDDPAPVQQWLPALAAAVDGKPPRHVPGWLGLFAIGSAGLGWMTEGRGASNRKAKRELDWRLRYPSWREGFLHGLRVAPLDASELASLIGEGAVANAARDTDRPDGRG